MRFRTLGFSGYLLSAFIVLLLAVLPQVVLYFFLLIPPYLISIILRFFAWRDLGKAVEDRLFKVISLMVLLLGVLFIISIALLVAEVLGFSFFIIPWVVYSFFEIVGYVFLGRRGSRLAYVGVVSIPAVLGLAYLLAVTTATETLVALPLVRIFLILLTASAFTVAFAFRRFKPIAGRYATPLQAVRRDTLSTYPEEEYVESIHEDMPEVQYVKKETTVQRRAAGGKTLRIEVISKSGDMVCRLCGGLNPIDAKVCSSCGRKPYLDGPGAKCPVCKAPLVYATRLDVDRLLCGVCFSELQIIR